MKYFRYFLLLIMLIPLNVFAEDMCNNNEIIIKDLEFVKKTGYTEELSEATLTNNKIDADVKMYEVGDSIVYQFTVVNDSDDEYAIDTRSLVDPDNHFEYKLDSKDHSKTIKGGTEKDFTLTATYKNEIEYDSFKAGKYDGGIDVSLMIADPALINPMTGNFFFYLLFLIFIVCIVFGIKMKKNSLTTLGMLGIFVIPLYTYAICTMNLDVDFNIEVGYVTPNPCTYDGNLVQGAEYTNGQYTYRYMQEHVTTYSVSSWNNISNDGWGVILTDKDSTDPVITTLCTSINDKPIVSMSSMFYKSRTTSIDTSSFDTSNVVNMNGMFAMDTAPNYTSLELKQFNTSNVTNMGAMFYNNSNLTTLDLSNWDFSNYNYGSLMMNLTGGGLSSLKTLNFTNAKMAENCSYAFGGMPSIEELIIDGLDTSNVTNMNAMFMSISISYLDLSHLDTSKVTDFGAMLGYTNNLVEVDMSNFDFSKSSSVSFYGMTCGGNSGIKKINLTNAKLPTNSNGMFQNLPNLEEIILDNVDTSIVTEMRSMFSGASGLTSLDLSSFDTSNVTNMSFMFHNADKLKSLDLSSFDLSNTTDTAEMFAGCSQLTTVYARTNDDLQKLNSSGNKPSNVQVLLKS